MTRSVRRTSVTLMVVAACVAAACTTDRSTPAGSAVADQDAAVSAVRLAGTGGRTHHGDDGRVTLTLAAHDSIEVHRGERVDTQPVTDAEEVSAPTSMTAELTVVAPGVEFALEDIEVTTSDDGAAVVVSGVPTEDVPPARFEHWELTAGAGADAPSSPSSSSAPPDVLELSDADVAAALAAAPQPPTITGVSTSPDEAATPSAFAADVEVLFTVDGTYELDVNTPGTADERPLQVLLAVGHDAQTVVLASDDQAGHVTLTDSRAVPGGVLATLRATGFDIASVDRVAAQVRRQPQGAGPRPWATLLGCTPVSASFQWRSTDDGTVKVGACPAPYGWIVSDAVPPNLTPDPALVAAAAAFATPATLVEHLDGLARATGVAAAAPGGRSLTLAVAASFEVAAGAPNVTVPVLLVQTDAAAFDAAAVAARIEAWRTALAVGATTLVFDVRIASQASPLPLLTAQGVQLPPT